MKKNILIVDDEAPIRELLELLFTGKGYRVTAAETADEALHAVRRDPPHLVVSDLQLRESDGLKFIDALKGLQPDTPVMLLTGVLFDAAVVKETLQGKISAYVQKTAPLAKILAEAERLLAA
ncbi:MAG: Photosynthetic apparatus regulatory protein RegA [Verrucomicrobiota bacterium]|jgi:DNA-binding NtrC family response regulator